MFYDMNAHIYFYSIQDLIADKILVSNNYMQGSEGFCMVIPHGKCSDSDKINSSVGTSGNQV